MAVNMSPQDDAKNVVFEGIVYKKGEGFMAGWKERYLILYIDKRLSYFIIDGEKKGVIDIKNLSVNDIKESAKTNKSDNYGFLIETGMIHFNLSTTAELLKNKSAVDLVTVKFKFWI